MKEHVFKLGDRVFIPMECTSCIHRGCKGTVIRDNYSKRILSPFVSWDNDTCNTYVHPKYLRYLKGQMQFEFMYE